MIPQNWVILYANSRHVWNTKIIVQLCFATPDFPELIMMAATRASEILGDARHFNKPKWIKQNRKYPADPSAIKVMKGKKPIDEAEADDDWRWL